MFYLFMFTGLPEIGFPSADVFFVLVAHFVQTETVSIVEPAEVWVSVTHKQEHISSR